jgi:hypothetical protein
MHSRKLSVDGPRLVPALTPQPLPMPLERWIEAWERLGQAMEQLALLAARERAKRDSGSLGVLSIFFLGGAQERAQRARLAPRLRR